MNELHSLLKRQLRRFTGDAESLLEEQTNFLRAINDAYLQFDTDRRMLEHSLELTSQELLERNAELSRINTELEMRVAARTAELSSSEARFRGLFEHAPVSIWEEDFSAVRQYIDDLRGAGVVDFSAYFDAHPEDVAESATRVKIVDVNRATLEMYQAESKAQLLADLSKVLGPESLIPFKEELLALARGETSFENETINYTLRGERRIVFVRLTVAPGYEQTWAKVFVVISDITERRQAEAALAAERDLLQALMDNIPDTIYFKDTSSRFTRINRAQARVLGVVTPEQAIGKTDLDFFHTPELAQGFYEEEQRLVQTGEALINRIEFNPTPDGQPRWFSATKVPIKDTEGRVTGIVGVSRDITERKQVEATLMESEQRYRELFESTRRQAQELALLDRVRQALAREVELTLIFRTVVEGIAQTFGYTQVSLYLIDGDVLVLQHQVGYNHVIERIPLTHGITGQVVRSQQPVLLEDVHNDSTFLEAIEGVTSEVCVPLFDQGQIAGVLNVESTQGVRLSEADLRLMTALGEQIGIALGRARLYSDVRESEEKYRSLVERLPAITYISAFDEAKTRLYVSPQNEKYLGFSPAEWLADPDLWRNQLHPEDRERVLSEAARFYQTGEPFISEYRTLSRNGKSVWFHDEAVIVRDANGQPQYIQGVKFDITERKQAEEAMRQSEERFKLMAWATKDAVWDWDLQTNQIWWGEGLQKIFHYSSETAQPSLEWRLDHIHPEDRAKVNRVIDQALEGGMEFWSKEYRFQRKDETYADIMDRGYIIRDDIGQPYRMIGAMMDITERKHMESTLLQANEQMGQFVNELQRRNREVALLNEMSRLLQACQSTEEAYRVIADLSNQMFPRTAGALYVLNTPHTLVSAIASWGELPSIERMFAPDDCWALRRGQTHPLNEDRTGSRCLHLSEPPPVVSYCLPLHAQGEILGVLHVQARHEESFDEAERQLAYTVVEQAGMALSNLKLREALREQSIRDPLTGLYNRRYMEEALKQQLSRLTRQLHPLGIIMIDIDHFKDFNDTHGHAAGDALLRELGQFLQSHIRGEDIACRYGGEEFTLIMPDASLEAAQQRAEHLRQEASQLRVHDAGQSHAAITLSAGVAIYPQHGRTIETVLRAADAALYRAKQEGRDRVIVAERAY